MDAEIIYNWKGASGTVYRYYVHSLPASFNAFQDGNYIYAKFIDNAWVPIYIGQGDLGERISDKHHQAACIKSKGATHVHVHLNSNESLRMSEENDILTNYPEAYKPKGCNEKLGA